MKIIYQLNKQDYVDFEILNLKNSRKLKQSLFSRRLMISSWVLLIPPILYIFNNIPTLYGYIVILPVYIIEAAIYPSVYYKRLKRKLYRSYDDNKYSDLFIKHELTIVEDGILVKDEFSESKWQNVTRIDESDNIILIYINSISAILIPKRVFFSAEEKSNFIGEVNRFKLDTQ